MTFKRSSSNFILNFYFYSVCYAIITLVVFIQPQWIGARSPASSGYFGLWKHCAVASVMTEMTTTSEFICRGRLDDFSSILNPAFRVATVFVGIAALVAILSVFGLILFICAPARQAYFIIAMMQTLAGKLLQFKNEKDVNILKKGVKGHCNFLESETSHL